MRHLVIVPKNDECNTVMHPKTANRVHETVVMHTKTANRVHENAVT